MHAPVPHWRKWFHCDRAKGADYQFREGGIIYRDETH